MLQHVQDLLDVGEIGFGEHLAGQVGEPFHVVGQARCAHAEAGRGIRDVVIVPDNRKDGELSWSSTGNYYWKYGQEPPAVYTFKNPHALAVTFSSSNEELATVDDQGNVTLIKPGLVYISAYFAGNSEYMTQGVGWLIVGSKGYVNMSFAQTDCKAALGQTMNSPEVLFKDY